MSHIPQSAAEPMIVASGAEPSADRCVWSAVRYPRHGAVDLFGALAVDAPTFARVLVTSETIIGGDLMPV